MATNRTMMQDAKLEDEPQACPLATQDILVNLKQRNWAFEHVGYGPANPDDEENNAVFWLKKSIMYNAPVAEVMGMRCGNCAAFIQTSHMIECMLNGLEAKDPRMEGGYDDDVIETAQLGFCELFQFKCAASRTCDAWLVGGPITDKKKEDYGNE